MTYTPTNWVDGSTPLNRTNMMRIENELALLDSGGVIPPGAPSATPPGSPADGQEWLSTFTGCPTWRFRYNAANATAYKWEFIGGPVLTALENTDQALPVSPTYSSLGPAFTVPRPGYWWLHHSSVAYTTGTAGSGQFFIAGFSSYPAAGILPGAVQNAVGIQAVSCESQNVIDQTLLFAASQQIGVALTCSSSGQTSRRRILSMQPVNIS